MQTFPEYWYKNYPNVGRKKAKEYYKMYIKGEDEIMNLTACTAPSKSINIPSISFGCFTTSVTTATTAGGCQKQEGTNPMTENSERDYLARRLRNAGYDKAAALVKQFHLHEYTGPKTYAELIDWIKNDKFTLDVKMTKRIDAAVEEDEDCGCFHNFTDGIIWNGRGFVSDSAGYILAIAAKENAERDARDIIMTSDAAAGLAALKAFESWTFTPAA